MQFRCTNIVLKRAKTDSYMGRLILRGMAGVSLLVASGCVSSTLDSNQFRAVGENRPAAQAANDSAQLTGTENLPSGGEGPIDLTKAAQSGAVKEKASGGTAATEQTEKSNEGDGNPEEASSVLDPVERAKAIAEMRAKAANGSGEKTRIGLLPEPSDDPIDATKQKKLKAELELDAKRAGATTTDAELEAKKKSIEALRRKAKTHFEDTLKRIEN